MTRYILIRHLMNFAHGLYFLSEEIGFRQYRKDTFYIKILQFRLIYYAFIIGKVNNLIINLFVSISTISNEDNGISSSVSCLHYQ